MTHATATTLSGQPLGISHKPSPSEVMFDEFEAANKPAFIGYLPYGFPNPDYSLKAFRTMVEHGVDAVEIGLPYSDPVMDGSVIQAASQIAIDNGEKIADVFRAVETVANAGGVPLVMSYWNLIYHYGVERFARDFENAGGAGLITPDLVPDEAGEWIEASDRHGLDRIFLVSPDSTDGRLKQYNLVILADDKQFFPPYETGFVLRGELAAKYPQVREALALLSGKINEQTMTELNYQVEVAKKDPADVARQFLRDQKILP